MLIFIFCLKHLFFLLFAAEYSKDLETAEFASKKGENDFPVDACKGWLSSCVYCDRRFCDWIAVSDDIQEKIPEGPGFFMTALKNKTTTEVVNILYDQTNIQKTALAKMNSIREKISDRKSKATKSVMMVRWMIVKDIHDKENAILCAHWNNSGSLPKFLTKWPGQNLMETNDTIVFSKQTQKWCYRQKNPVWRKPKPPPPRNTEEVAKCSFQSCEICDSYFTPWKRLAEVVDKDAAPSRQGLVMLSVVMGRNRTVLVIKSHPKNVVLPIKSAIAELQRSEGSFLKEFVNKNPELEVRWMVLADVDCDNSCFLYAHWLNADAWPPHNFIHSPLPGEMSLNKNKHFIFHTKDKKWFHEIESLKSSKFNKIKDRRRLLDELDNDENFEEEQ